MKRALPLLIAFLFLLTLTVFTNPTSAQQRITNEVSTEAVGTRDRLQDLREKRLDVREKAAQKREDIREKVGEVRDEARERAVLRIEEAFNKILIRFDAALARLDSAAQRIASRADKLNERGVDTTEVEAALVEAENAGAAAAASIQEAKNIVQSLDPGSDSVRDSVLQAKEALGQAKDSLKNYHTALVSTLRLLKSASDLAGEEQDEL